MALSKFKGGEAGRGGGERNPGFPSLHERPFYYYYFYKRSTGFIISDGGGATGSWMFCPAVQANGVSFHGIVLEYLGEKNLFALGKLSLERGSIAAKRKRNVVYRGASALSLLVKSLALAFKYKRA